MRHCDIDRHGLPAAALNFGEHGILARGSNREFMRINREFLGNYGFAI